jgi:serine/threonine kinase 33
MAGLSGIVARKSISDLQKEAGRRTRVNSEDDVEQKYKFGKVLGKGSFGVVIQAKQLSSAQDFAIKLIQKERGSQMELIEREVSILQSMDHPHIIHLEEVLETDKKIYLVIELCLGGELSEVIKQKGPFAEEDSRIIIRSLADALAYMHIKGMVHRDLKLENILVTGDDPLNVKITDFGLAYQMQKGLPGEDGHTLDGTCGTLLYMAPEVLENKLAYSDHCDVWSLGVIMYEILCGRVPFYDTSPSKLEELIKSGKLTFPEPEWKEISDKGAAEGHHRLLGCWLVCI